MVLGKKLDFSLERNVLGGGVDLGENDVGYLSMVLKADVVPVAQAGGQEFDLLRGDAFSVQQLFNLVRHLAQFVVVAFDIYLLRPKYSFQWFRYLYQVYSNISCQSL